VTGKALHRAFLHFRDNIITGNQQGLLFSGGALAILSVPIGGLPMANDNVVALHGAILPDVAGVDEGLIAELERLLEAARSGEIIGLAGTYQHKNRTISYSFAGRVGSYALLGGLDCVRERLLRLALATD
jgi:hypothetical protein